MEMKYNYDSTLPINSNEYIKHIIETNKNAINQMHVKFIVSNIKQIESIYLYFDITKLSFSD